MDRCAILVDAGYLLGAAGTLLNGDPGRAALKVDHAELAKALIVEAEGQTGMPVLRLLWYDGAINSQPSQDHRALRVLPDVKVRLGELVVRHGKMQQKGVDSYLQRDLTTLARNKAVADVVLLGGDEDLRRALEEAQDFGVRVHLWGVEAAAPEYNQSQSLIAEADRRWVIPADWIGRFVDLEPAGLEAEASIAGTSQQALPQTVSEGSSPTTPKPANASAPMRATPAELERLAASFGKGSARAGDPEADPGWTVVQAEHDDIPRLQELTTSRDAWKDNEEDATAPGRTASEIGEVFGNRWRSRATADQLEALRALARRAPPYLDGELLRYAERNGIDTWEDDPSKHAVRAGFWTAVLEDSTDG